MVYVARRELAFYRYYLPVNQPYWLYIRMFRVKRMLPHACLEVGMFHILNKHLSCWWQCLFLCSTRCSYSDFHTPDLLSDVWYVRFVWSVKIRKSAKRQHWHTHLWGLVRTWNVPICKGVCGSMHSTLSFEFRAYVVWLSQTGIHSDSISSHATIKNAGFLQTGISPELDPVFVRLANFSRQLQHQTLY